MTNKDHCSQCGATLNEFEKTTSSLYKDHSLAGLCFGCKVKWIEEKHGDADSELFKLRDKARQRNFKFMQKKRASGSRQCSAILSQDAYNTLTRLRDVAAQAGKPQSFGDIIEAALNVYVSLGQSKQNDTTSEYKDDNAGDSKDNATYICSDDNINTKQKSEQNYICVKEIEDPVPEPKTPTVSDLPDPAPTEKQVTEKPLDLFKQEQKPEQEYKDVPKHGTPEHRKWLINEIERLKKSGLGGIKIAHKFNYHKIKTVSGQRFERSTADTFFTKELKKRGLKWDSKSKKAVPIEKKP